MSVPAKKEPSVADNTEVYTVGPEAGRPADPRPEPPKTEAIAPTEVSAGNSAAPPPEAAAAGAPTLDAPPAAAQKPAKKEKPAPLRNPVRGYEVLAELGRGGMGVVYKARQKSLNRVVALKMVIAGEFASPDAVVRFLGEAEVVASLHHPNIIQIYEFGQHEGFPYFTLEYLEGGSLDCRLDGTPWPAADAAETIETLARAMRAAHLKGIVHRDLKPGNILLDGDGTLKITDFGLAKRVEGGSGLTQTGSIMGTPSYMAPEQARGQIHDVGPAADTYALGAMLYELLTGRPPFKAETPADTIVQLLEQEPVAPTRLNAKCPRDLETICLKCLQKDPAKRYTTAKALADDLKRFRDGEPIKARPVGRTERAARWSRKHPAAAVLVGFIALSALALFVVGWWYNLHLKAALRTAEERRQEAEAQRRLVADSYVKRLDAIDDMVGHMDGRLAMMSGMRSVRVEFLNDVLGLSQQLLKDSPNDPRARRQAGRVYLAFGDLALSGGDEREAENAYLRARQLQEPLTQEFPDEAGYQTDLARTCSHQGHLFARAHRPDDALRAYDKALELADALLDNSPDDQDCLQRCGYYRLRKGSVLEEKNDLEAALSQYRKAFELQTRLVDLFPRVASHHTESATTAMSLGYALAERDPDEARQWLERAVASSRSAFRLGPTDQTARDFLLAYADLADFHKRHHDHAALATLAVQRRADFARSAPETYNAACFAANAVEVVRQDPAAADDERRRLADQYAGQALALLGQAVDEGFNNLDHMTIDTDLDPLRERADFKAFWATLEKRFPTRVVTPGRLLVALRDDYNNNLGLYKRLDTDAVTVADHKRALAHKPALEATAKRMLAMADKNPNAPAALEALAWVLDHAGEAADRQTVASVRADALRLLERDHVQTKNFGNACRVLAKHPSAAVDKLLRAAESNSPEADVRALAAWALAQSLARQSELAYERGDTTAADVGRRAEDQLEKVIKEHGTLATDDGTLADVARRRLDELRTLSPGRPARSVEGNDMDGRPMRLAEFKGKVVLLDFWANWCGFCRQMYPSERALVEHMKGRPFVVLGVNCDEDKEVARRAVTREKLNWRSWWDGDGGVLRDQWQVDSFPTLVLIDHGGVIRKKWLGKPEAQEVDAAVEQLVRQAEQAGRP